MNLAIATSYNIKDIKYRPTELLLDLVKLA